MTNKPSCITAKLSGEKVQSCMSLFPKSPCSEQSGFMSIGHQGVKPPKL